MTLVLDSGRQDQPSTHVLAIGVGRYPHLLGGDKTLAAKPLGLKQLESPPVSVKAVVDWFLAPLLAPGGVGFSNPDAPLGTIHALASAVQPVVIPSPTGPVQLDSATKESIDNAFAEWLAAIKRNDSNIGVFYFCGHGMMVSEHYLLAEDYGSGLQPSLKAFDVSSTIRAIEREVKGALYFFIDACREVSRDMALSVGANPNALMPADLTRRVSRKLSVCISACGEGQLAFAEPGGQVSRFTKALIRALSGFSGTKSAGRATWEVDGESLASAIRMILEYDGRKKADSSQISEQHIQGSSVPLIQLMAPPKVSVDIDYLPETLRTKYELYLRSSNTHIVQTKEDRALQADVPMGMYSIGAVDPAGVLQADVRDGEDLRPPRYNLRLGAQL